MKIDKNESGFAAILVAVALSAILVFGSVGVAGAANNAKPGDTLYPVDTAIEDIRLALTNNSETEVKLRTQYSAERVSEIQALLLEKGINAPGLDVALANLTSQKENINSLVAQNKELKNQVKQLESQLKDEKSELKTTYKTIKKDLQSQKADLKAQLAQAKVSGDTASVLSLETQLSAIQSQLDTLDSQENEADDALDLDNEDEEEPEETTEPEEREEDTKEFESSGKTSVNHFLPHNFVFT